MAVYIDNDTIAALSTPLGRGGIAVIRISGEKTRTILKHIISDWPDFPTPRKAYHSYVIDDKRAIDECVAIFFKAPNSYTGEDSAEISIHSNPFLVEEILDLIYSIDHHSIRNAMPGEFTFRAYKNGKMDLLQAEAVKELIDANSRYYAHMSFGSLEGRLSEFMQDLKKELIALASLIETKIEFEEDQFFDEITIANQLDAPLQRIETLLSNTRFNDILNKGLSVVIVGKVNVGKSSLFNTLLMEERSIISDIPGTTRDFIREKLFIDGFPIEITDVAGINRDTNDQIEALGIHRSMERLESCDAAILLLDASKPLEEVDKELYLKIKDKTKLIAANKVDRPGQHIPDDMADYFSSEDEPVTPISVKSHIHIDIVREFLRNLVTSIKDKESEFAINRRQRNLLEHLKESLSKTRQMAHQKTAEAELIAEEIRSAIDTIGKLMGEITPDDILNKIFSDFCVGK